MEKNARSGFEPGRTFGSYAVQPKTTEYSLTIFGLVVQLPNA